MLEFKLKRYKSYKKNELNCRKLVSENILDAKDYLIRTSLDEYRLADKDYESIASARFDSMLAEVVEYFEKDSSITDMKIVKHSGLTGPSLLSPICKCGKNLTRVDAEITRNKKKSTLRLFYFCDYCGVEKVKKGFGL